MLSSTSCVAVANGACCRRTSRLIRRSTTTFEVGGCWGHGNGYTTDCAGSPRPQSGAERWNYRQSDGEDDRKRGIRGYDGGKRKLWRKRHIVLDVLGLLLIVVVHSVGIQDRNGAKHVLTRLISRFPGLKLVWADGGYAGKLVEWVATVLQRTLSIVKRPRKSQGFRVLQWRWIVERTFGWLNRSRRLSKDFEALPETTETWIRIAMIQLMTKRLAAKT